MKQILLLMLAVLLYSCSKGSEEVVAEIMDINFMLQNCLR